MNLNCNKIENKIFSYFIFNVCLTKLLNFADDNFYVEWNADLGALIVNLEKTLEMITKWIRDSGLIVNKSKTEICLFHKNDQSKISIRLQDVLGVHFDSKLNWNAHIAAAIS